MGGGVVVVVVVVVVMVVVGMMVCVWWWGDSAGDATTRSLSLPAGAAAMWCAASRGKGALGGSVPAPRLPASGCCAAHPTFAPPRSRASPPRSKKMPGHNMLGLEIREPIIERANKWAASLGVTRSVLFLR